MSTGRATAQPIHVDFIAPADLPVAGRLGLTSAPGANEPAVFAFGRDLQADLDRLGEHYRVATLVSLLENAEYQLLRIDDPVGQAELRGITLLRFPIADMGIPAPEAAGNFATLIRGITARLQSGSTIVVHCRAGKGRSGLVAAAVLAVLGQPAASAIDNVRRVRSGAVETAAQEQYVHEFARLFALQDGRRG